MSKHKLAQKLILNALADGQYHKVSDVKALAAKQGYTWMNLQSARHKLQSVRTHYMRAAYYWIRDLTVSEE